MKWLFTLLLLANLVILGWGWQRDPDAAVNLPRERPGIGNLQLLAELDTAPEKTSGMATAEAPPPGAGPGNTPVEPADPAPRPDLPPEPVLSARPPAAVVTGNRPAEPLQADAESQPTEGSVAPLKSAPVVTVCGAFGPFERGAEARSLAESLASQGMDTSLRRESMEKPIGYWVMIPPLESREAAIEKVKQLRASGIKDIRRFVKGDQKDAISLGVFSKRSNALSRLQEIAGKGHRAEVVPRLISVPSYWVDYRSDRTRVERAAARVAESHDGIKNEQYPCPRVVTSGGIF